MMADEDISLNEDQILDNLDDTNGEMLNEVSKYLQTFWIWIFLLLLFDCLVECCLPTECKW